MRMVGFSCLLHAGEKTTSKVQARCRGSTNSVVTWNEPLCPKGT
jgi:hypothetical protein